MDTYKEEYVLLDRCGNNEGVHTRQSKGGNTKHTVHSIDGQNILSKPLGKVYDSKSAASVLYQMRFSVVPKNGVLILSQANEVIGNHIITDNINAGNIAKVFATYPTATSVIIYGNHQQDVGSISDGLGKLDIKVLDYLNIVGGGEDVSGAYKYVSSSDKGLLRDVENKYGTNRVSENTTEQELADIKAKAIADGTFMRKHLMVRNQTLMKGNGFIQGMRYLKSGLEI